MEEEKLFEVNPRHDVEWQVDAMFAPLYATIPDGHHRLIERVERDMVNAIKAAMRLPATDPAPISEPEHWPRDSRERLLQFLADEKQRNLGYEAPGATKNGH